MADQVPRTDDRFVRWLVAGALNVRRYRSWYAAGLVLVIALAAASPARRVVPALDGRPAAPNAVAADVATQNPVDAQVSFERAQTDEPLAEAVANATEQIDAEADEAVAEPVAEFDPDSAKVAPPGNPALAVGGPTAGKVCDTFGLAMLLATLAAPAAPVPVPLSPVFGAVTPVYLACAEVPRPTTRMVCDSDDSVPAVPGAPVPVNPAATALVVEQMKAVEAATGAGSTVSSALASTLGCRAVT